jgi:hypothetical protein
MQKKWKENNPRILTVQKWVLLQCTAASSLPSHTTSGHQLQHYITGTVLSSSNLKSAKTHKTHTPCMHTSTAGLYCSDPFLQNAFSRNPPPQQSDLPANLLGTFNHAFALCGAQKHPTPAQTTLVQSKSLRHSANKVMACRAFAPSEFHTFQ